MRILILNQPFHPDVVATAQIAKDLADEFVAQGHSVTAIASRSIYGQSGAVLPRRETVDGIDIIRVGSNLFGKGSTVGRLADFANYYVQAVIRGLFMRRADAVICLTTPPYIAVVGLFLKVVRRTQVIYWLMDVYPDVMVSHGMIRERGLLRRILRRLHRFVLDHVDATVALGRCMKDRLVDQGADPAGIHVVHVWSPVKTKATEPARDDVRANSYRDGWRVGDRLLIMYSGNFGLAHDVDTFLATAEALKDDDRIRFAFVGGGKRKPIVEAFVRDRGLSNCVIEPYQPLEKLDELLSAADVHLISMEAPMCGLVVPSKFFGAAAAGRATIFIGPGDSEIALLIDEWECGGRIKPGDSASLTSLLQDIAADREKLNTLGVNARKGFETHSSRRASVEKILQLITQ